MTQKVIESFGMTGCSIEMNLTELRQASEMANVCKKVLESHKTDKKQYISDQDLKMIMVILSVISREYHNHQESWFDKALKELDEQIPKPEPKEPENKEAVLV